MNPLAILSFARANWRLILVGALVAGNFLFYKLWQSTKAEFIAYGAGVEALGKQSLKDKERIEKEQKSNLEAVKKDYEDKIPQVRADAVANYLARQRLHDNTGRGIVPGTSAGFKANDGASPEQVAARNCADEQFIADAAEDALMLEEWRMWAIRNRVPIE